jgi:hypothetical protein
MTEPAEPLGANILDLVLTRENQILTAVRGVRTEVDEIEAVDVETHPSLYDLVKGIAASLTTNQLATAAALKEIAAQVATIYKATVKPPTGVWTFSHGGYVFRGASPMPASIIDTAQGWGVKVTSLVDALGEPADAGATVAYAVDDTTLVTLVDNGDGSATFGSAIVAGGGVVLPASTALNATVTNPDGTSFVLSDVITVVAGDAVTGTFAFTPGA